jgi:hypothetical protein
MHRAEMLKIDGEPPPEFSQFAEKEAWIEALERHSVHRVLRLLDDRHLDKARWDQRVEKTRSTIRREARQGFDDMKRLLEKDTCVANVFASVYRQNGDTGRGSIGVAKACGGCPACREAGRERHPDPMPRPYPVWDGTVSHLHDRLRHRIGEDGQLCLFFTSEDPRRRWKRKLVRAMRTFVRLGTRVIAAPQRVLDLLSEEGIGQKQPVFFVPIPQPHDVMGHFPDLPHLIYCPTRETLSTAHLSYNGKAGRILVAPRDAPDPRAPRRRLRMMMPTVFNWGTFFKKVGQ